MAHTLAGLARVFCCLGILTAEHTDSARPQEGTPLGLFVGHSGSSNLEWVHPWLFLAGGFSLLGTLDPYHYRG
jgi:hypothetical protein